MVPYWRVLERFVLALRGWRYRSSCLYHYFTHLSSISDCCGPLLASSREICSSSERLAVSLQLFVSAGKSVSPVAELLSDCSVVAWLTSSAENNNNSHYACVESRLHFEKSDEINISKDFKLKLLQKHFSQYLGIQLRPS